MTRKPYKRLDGGPEISTAVIGTATWTLIIVAVCYCWIQLLMWVIR